MLNKIFKFIYIEVVYNGHLQSAGAVSIVYFSCLLFDLNVGWDSLIVVYLSFYLIYLYNRYKEIEIDALTNGKRTKHIAKINKNIPCIFFNTAILIGLVLYFHANFLSSCFILAIIIFGILYTVYFKNLTKKIFILKNIYVSLVFAVLVFYPFVYYKILISHILLSVVIITIFIFLRSIFMQILLDLKDLESDKQQKLLTLGALIGCDRTLIFLQIFSIITIIFLFLSSYYFSIFNLTILMFVFIVFFDFYSINLVRQNNFLGYMLIGGEFLLLPILILIPRIF